MRPVVLNHLAEHVLDKRPQVGGLAGQPPSGTVVAVPGHGPARRRGEQRLGLGVRQQRVQLVLLAQHQRAERVRDGLVAGTLARADHRGRQVLAGRQSGGGQPAPDQRRIEFAAEHLGERLRALAAEHLPLVGPHRHLKRGHCRDVLDD